jgi:serine/threonine protein phosphatase PrpC
VKNTRDPGGLPGGVSGWASGALEPGGGNFAEVCGPLLVDAFANLAARVDSEYRGTRMGSTATALLLQRRSNPSPSSSGGGKSGGGEWAVACAWVGDPRAVAVGPNGRVLQVLTYDHRLDNDAEKARCLEVAAAEGAVHGRLQGARRTVVAQRISAATGQLGPWAVLNETTGVSTTVTRALGDSLAASAVIATPDVTHAVVPCGSRLVVCSDGVWDVLTEAQVARLIQSVRDPARAARRVARAAKQTRLYSGFSADDISATVINLD